MWFYSSLAWTFDPLQLTLHVAMNKPFNRMFLFTAKRLAAKVQLLATHPLTEITSNAGEEMMIPTVTKIFFHSLVEDKIKLKPAPVAKSKNGRITVSMHPGQKADFTIKRQIEAGVYVWYTINQIILYVVLVAVYQRVLQTAFIQITHNGQPYIYLLIMLL